MRLEAACQSPEEALAGSPGLIHSLYCLSSQRLRCACPRLPRPAVTSHARGRPEQGHGVGWDGAARPETSETKVSAELLVDPGL